ncbi:protein phosphatase 1 regulatory subunit 29 [Synchiropus splendidus]|uniref:protein phosphatase 1 regulatory subunit 29 n=1 Tax=Synchiropus splendidus TaxID=270530 RepID=UPI00237DDF13|nr:protein phosphatase 1 regulatory subunit 29 [Synchiropus splendidus]
MVTMPEKSITPTLIVILSTFLIFSHVANMVSGDCWLIEGDKGYVWLAICSQNQPPYETIPQHINNTVHDLRLNENKLKAVAFTSMYRFTNLTDLNLTKNEISYIEDGAFAGQANLQVLQLGYNKLTNLTEGMMRGLGRLQCLFLQHNLIEAIAHNAFWECLSLSSIDLSSNKLARIDPSTFTSLNHLMVCELAANPFNCGCDLYSFLTWLESFNNVTHTYDRLQCETPREMYGYPLLSPIAAGHSGRNAKNILQSHCKDGVMIHGMTSLPPDLDGSSGNGLEMFGGGGFNQKPTPSSSSTKNFVPSIKLQHISMTSASVMVEIPQPYSKMYILTQYNQTHVSDVMNLRNVKEKITLDKLKPDTGYTFCIASLRNSQRNNHSCLWFTTRSPSSHDIPLTPSTTTHYIMTIVGCLFGMLIVLGFVYYCLRKKRVHDEKKKSICVKKTILEMRYGPEVAAAVGNDPSTVHKFQEQSRDHHQYQHHHGGKLSMSTSSSSGMLHPGNTSSSRLSSIPQVEKMATAFSEALAASKVNYMDIRSGGGDMDRMGDSVHVGMRDLRDDDGTDLGDDSDDDGHGSASEISTIAMEVDKVNQIINNCIDALKLDAAAVAASGAPPNSTPSSNPTSPPPTSTSSLTRGLIPISQGLTETCQVMGSNKIPPPPPLPLNTPLSERPGISGGGFVATPPYRPPPPANAVRPIQRQMSADAAVVIVNSVKKQCSTTSCGSVGQDRERGGTRVYSLDVPEPRSPDGCNQQQQQYTDRASPLGCGEPLERLPLVSSVSCSGGGSVAGESVGVQHHDNQKQHHYHHQQQQQQQQQQQHHHQQQQQLDVQQDYHCSEHRHSVPALYYEGSHQGSPAQRVSFLKPLTRSRKDAASYSQLSPARHHSSYSGYSSSPEYTSESSLRIWERFRPYRKGQRDEACYVTAGNALRKKVQFAKGEDLHDILDYWKGVSAQQKL